MLTGPDVPDSDRLIAHRDRHSATIGAEAQIPGRLVALANDILLHDRLAFLPFPDLDQTRPGGRGDTLTVWAKRQRVQVRDIGRKASKFFARTGVPDFDV